MYLDHFNLSCRPFEETPDHRFLYLSPQHARALANIEYALTTRDSFVVIAGEIGMGKTTLLNQVFASLPNGISVARVAHTTLTPKELLHKLLAEFGIHTYEDNKVYLLERLREYFSDQKSAGRQVAILVDEAQNLTISALEELRLLSSMDLDLAGLVSVVLVGQPELNALLDSPQLEQLRQRVRLRQHLSPLNRDETHAYIDKRLEVAGSGADALFSSEAIDRVFIYTAGVPRLINTLCESALASCWSDEEASVSGERIDEVAADLGWRRQSQGSSLQPPAIRDEDGARRVYGWLRRSSSDGEEFWVPIYQLPFTIGRTSKNRLRLRNSHTSRSHAVIEEVDGRLSLRDLGSRNGTAINGARITEPVSLTDGDRIAFGNIELTFQAFVETGTPALSDS